MMIDGLDPTKLSRTEKTPVDLSGPVRMILPTLQALAIDGICIGISVKSNEESEE